LMLILRKLEETESNEDFLALIDQQKVKY